MGEKEELRQEQPSKMSYEQLENVAHQLSEQVKQLYMSLQKSNLENTFQRLNYLFKVVENGHAFKPDFLNKCTEEIENIMAIPEEDTKEEETSDIKPEE